ncbi:hypothetical protein [Microbacterium sp. SS28]|uniref:hypothetical protein n=1 Tax=Microbacterium sp. SS28 TaxID=2919948 RepID=UPI001FAA7D95|nr:hypothetical protein [Microbacterium sp. SS28]
MSDQQIPARNPGLEEVAPFEELLGGAAAAPAESSFATVFRGYDKDEVDSAIARLTSRMRADSAEIAFLEERYRRVNETAGDQSREALERLQAESDAKLAAAETRNRENLERFQAKLTAANTRIAKAEQSIQAEVAAATETSRETVERLEAELTAATARATKAESRVKTLTDELVDGGGETGNRPQFEEILRVAEEQASQVIRNASIQGDRLLEASRSEIENRRKEVQAEAEAIRTQAGHDAQQARLKIETELMAHQARLEREAAHAAEKVSQAEQEAAAIRSEAERGAAALRSLVARETGLSRSEAEEAVRELRVRALEFEESLTRRQDDAQQEFLVLHNQAVAHAERITQDANDQVAASLEHAQRVGAKADDFDRLMRAQAQQIEADANIRAREQLDRARVKAQKIIDTVTTHSQSVLRDAEDRTRQLRWQQHQLMSFMAEVKELIRPEMTLEGAEQATEPFLGADALAPVAGSTDEASVDEISVGDVSVDDVDAELAELVEQAADAQDDAQGDAHEGEQPAHEHHG